MTFNKIKNQSTSIPQDLQVRKLSGNLYEFIGHENIVPTTIERDDELSEIFANLLKLTKSIRRTKNDIQ